jgi:hypothetical protein
MPRERGRRSGASDKHRGRRDSRRARAPEPEDTESTIGKTGFSNDGQYFFGTSATEKRGMRRTRDNPRSINIDRDLDLSASPRRAPRQVGKNVRLIDLAMDDSIYRPDNLSSNQGSSDKIEQLPPFKKLGAKENARRRLTRNRSLPPATARQTRAFAGRKTGRHFQDIVANGKVKTRGLPGREKIFAPPSKPIAAPKKITAPPSRVSDSYNMKGTPARGTALRKTSESGIARITPAHGTPTRGTPTRGTPTRGLPRPRSRPRPTSSVGLEAASKPLLPPKINRPPIAAPRKSRLIRPPSSANRRQRP